MAGVSGTRVWGIAAVLATAAVLGVGIGVAAQHASRCQSSAAERTSAKVPDRRASGPLCPRRVDPLPRAAGR